MRTKGLIIRVEFPNWNEDLAKFDRVFEELNSIFGRYNCMMSIDLEGIGPDGRPYTTVHEREDI